MSRTQHKGKDQVFGPLAPADEQTFEDLYLDALPRLIGKIRGKFGLSVADAEDLAAESLIKARQAFEKFDPDEGSTEAWLWAIAYRTVLNHLDMRKTQSRREERVAEGLGRDEERRLYFGERRPEDLLDVVASGNLPEEESQSGGEAGERGKILKIGRDAFDSLSEADKDIIRLVNSLSTAGAAKALGIKEGTVRVRYHRAKEQFINACRERGLT